MTSGIFDFEELIIMFHTNYMPVIEFILYIHIPKMFKVETSYGGYV